MEKIKYQAKNTQNSGNSETYQEQQPKRYNNNRTYNNDKTYNNNQKTRYQNKESNHKNKFGFDYDENKISYNTEIPEMPQKPKTRPDDTKINKKLSQLQTKANQLKKARKEKKDSYKNGNKGLTDQIEVQKKNINLGKACLVVLNFDRQQIESNITDIESKIQSHKRRIDGLNRPTDRQGAKNIKIQEMNYVQLSRQQDRLNNRLSTEDLSKAQQVELHNQLQKIKKRKFQVEKQKVNATVDQDKIDQINTHKQAIDRLKNVKSNLSDKITDIDTKIQAIKQDIEELEELIEQIHEKQRNTDNQVLLEEAAQLKTKIYAIWDEYDTLKLQHNTKINEFEQQQQQIKYINWAKQVKARKIQDWEEEKQQRKKQRLRQKQREKQNKTEKKEGDKKEGDKKQGDKPDDDRPKYERKVINKNQKQIDLCAFLIQYCKDLSSGNQREQKKVQKEVNLNEALKTGQWAGMKNVQVLQSKKAKIQDQVQRKTYKKKDHKVQVAQPTDRFSHTFFVAQAFDSVKVLPPTKQEELEKTINQIEDKIEYYLAHPQEEVGRALLPQNNDRDTKQKSSKRIINTEQFPSLK